MSLDKRTRKLGCGYDHFCSNTPSPRDRRATSCQLPNVSTATNGVFICILELMLMMMIVVINYN